MTPSHEIETRLRETAEELLREKRVDLFLGYENASLPFRTIPLLLTSPEEVERLVWNPFCTTNLAVYLPGLFKAPADAREAKAAPSPPTVGVVLKGCDTRSVVALIQERQVPRDKLVLVGVACPGMVDRRKAEKALGEHEALRAEEDVEGDVRAVVEDGTEVSLPRGEIVACACSECRSPSPLVHDTLLGEPVEAKDQDAGRRVVAEFEAKALSERWAHLQEALSKCIRCNACRQACPMCYCKDCLLDQTRPRWVGASTDISDVTIYHLVRAFHMAGRCVACGACEQACPMGIDTRLLVRKLSLEVEELYGYRAGEAIDAIAPLSAFAADDSEDFVTEP